MKKLRLIIILCLCYFLPISFGYAAKIDTLLVHSLAMNQDIPAIVITPDGYQKSGKLYPTIYLLHGYSGNYTDWTSKAPSVTTLVDQHQVIVVCPDGDYNSWYVDSPIDPASQYETYVATEVVSYVDQHYRTIKDRSGRAITGLSMGGHGALFLAIRHQDTFGAGGSMSGGVKLTFDVNAWEIALKLGKYEEHPLRWDSLSVVNMVDMIQPDSLPLIIDCGVDDFFIDINRELHQALLERNIPHDYIERPGSHSWNYWDNAVKYQFLFFHTFFDQGLKSPEEPPGLKKVRNPSE